MKIRDLPAAAAFYGFYAGIIITAPVTIVAQKIVKASDNAVDRFTNGTPKK